MLRTYEIQCPKHIIFLNFRYLFNLQRTDSRMLFHKISSSLKKSKSCKCSFIECSARLDSLPTTTSTYYLQAEMDLCKC